MIITNEFSKVLNDCNIKYKSKIPIYGDSWKRMSVSQLDARLQEEIRELESVDTQSGLYDELIDIINVSMMLAQRIKESSQSGDSK